MEMNTMRVYNVIVDRHLVTFSFDGRLRANQNGKAIATTEGNVSDFTVLVRRAGKTIERSMKQCDQKSKIINELNKQIKAIVGKQTTLPAMPAAVPSLPRHGRVLPTIEKAYTKYTIEEIKRDCEQHKSDPFYIPLFLRRSEANA